MNVRASVRLGTGAGYSGDRIEPAVLLAERGELDYLVFECLAERTIAAAVKARRSGSHPGFDPYLEDRMRAVLPACVRNNVRIITNMGAANAPAAAARTAEIARKIGLSGLRIAAVQGDDVLDLFRRDDAPLVEGVNASDLVERLVSANAYLGAEPIVAALAQGANVVIAGRVADPSLFLAPLIHEFEWRRDDWDRLGAGSIVGHLMECAGQVTGGYYADPGVKDVADLATLGFPIAEVGADGAATITKLAGTGGRVSLGSCKEQLLYEVHDPSRYLTPDVTVDFTGVTLKQVGEDRVSVRGGRGSQRPDKLKVSVGYDDGFMGEGQISYAGPGAQTRARLALEIVKERLRRLGDEILEERFDLIGIDSVGPRAAMSAPAEVRARVAIRTRTAAGAAWAGREIEALYTNGPAGGGGATQAVRSVLAIASTFLDRSLIQPSIVWERI